MKTICITGTSAAGKSTVVNHLLAKGAGALRFERPVTATDRAPRHRENCGQDGRPCDQVAYDQGAELGDLLMHRERCEINGVDYHFMTTEEFAHLANPAYSGDEFVALLRSGRSKEDIMKKVGTEGFYEYALVYNQLKGVPRFALDAVRSRGNIPMLILDIQGVQIFRRVDGRENVLTLAIIPPSLDVARERMLARDPDLSVEELERRLAVAEQEIAEIMSSDDFDHVVVNHQGKELDTVAEVQRLIQHTAQRRRPRRAAIV